MKVTLNWLRDFVDIDVAPEKLAQLLTNSGNEVEEIIYQDKYLKNVVVGKILEINKHPNAERLVVCKVDIGTKITQIVTAAKNIKVNDLVPVSLAGANLANGIHIENSKLRGVDSFGMFCSVEELGVTDYDGEKDGIMILDNDAVVGQNISDALLMNDVIFDINVTANRPDCMSIIGIAREISALLNKPLKEQKLIYETCKHDDVTNYVSVNVLNETLCPRYMATVIKNIKIQKSPKWLRARLVSVDIKPINNIVDITNYVLVEYGQPMHAFDQKFLDGKQIIVRVGAKGESIKVLNQNTYEVDENTLLICDKNKPVVIAGIIGGLNSCVNELTETAVFECACFERSIIRKTSRKIGVRTDSTARFEKGVDLGSPEIGMKRALNLVYTLKAGEIVSGIIDTAKKAPKKKSLNFSLKNIFKILGFKIESDTILNILNNLTIKTELDGDTLKCEIPVYRTDIENDADIAEEIIRMYGYDVYDNFNTAPLCNASITIGEHDSVLLYERKIKHMLCDYGYYETVNFSLCNHDVLDKLLISKSSNLYNMIKIENPISEDISYLRTTMANAILATASKNIAHKNTEFKIFEAGRIYLPKSLPLNELPNEVNMMSICSTNQKDNFYTFKGIIENILRDFNLSYKLVYSSLSYLHPGISADVINEDNNDVLCSFGQIHPKVSKNFELPTKTFYAEINIDKLLMLKPKSHSVKMISKYPYVERDLAIICDENITVGQILESVKKSCGKLYYSSKVFDIYRNESLGSNKKSVAFSFKLVSYEKTLTDEEINQTVNKILKDLKYKLGADLR